MTGHHQSMPASHTPASTPLLVASFAGFLSLLLLGFVSGSPNDANRSFTVTSSEVSMQGVRAQVTLHTENGPIQTSLTDLDAACFLAYAPALDANAGYTFHLSDQRTLTRRDLRALTFTSNVQHLSEVRRDVAAFEQASGRNCAADLTFHVQP